MQKLSPEFFREIGVKGAQSQAKQGTRYKFTKADSVKGGTTGKRKPKKEEANEKAV